MHKSITIGVSLPVIATLTGPQPGNDTKAAAGQVDSLASAAGGPMEAVKEQCQD
jgi:hypothetical protein